MWLQCQHQLVGSGCSQLLMGKIMALVLLALALLMIRDPGGWLAMSLGYSRMQAWLTWALLVLGLALCPGAE